MVTRISNNLSVLLIRAIVPAKRSSGTPLVRSESVLTVKTPWRPWRVAPRKIRERDRDRERVM